jgi:uncharacterized protein HemY
MGSEIVGLLIVIGCLALLIGAARRMIRKRGAGGRKTRFWTARRRSFRPWDQEAELLRLCHGDRKLAERLIAHELERTDSLSRAGAALAAATRLRHDKD